MLITRGSIIAAQTAVAPALSKRVPGPRYAAPNEPAGRAGLDELTETWGARYPAMVRTLRGDPDGPDLGRAARVHVDTVPSTTPRNAETRTAAYLKGDQVVPVRVLRIVQRR